MSPARPGFGRRELLGGAAALAAVELAAGCGGKPESSTLARLPAVKIPAVDLVEGGRLVVMLDNNPVELRRGPDGVTALMLRCTHTGCVVRWRSAENVYVCPCHDGRFGADGRVISGPPPLPLRTVPVVLAADKLIVGA